MHSRGFTLVELILVIVVIGILAAVVGPRFFDRAVFDERMYAEEVRASLRHAQKLALASGCRVQVRFASDGSHQLWRDANCAAGSGAAADYSAAVGEAVPAPATPALNGFPLAFGALGQPLGGVSGSHCGRSGQVASVTLGAHCLSIEAETGLIR
ncbi:hypothetical protein D3C78_708370 [compost metagenome]